MNYKTDGRLAAKIIGKEDGKLKVAVGYLGEKTPIYIEKMTSEQFENMFEKTNN